MADNSEHMAPVAEEEHSFMEKIADRFHHHHEEKPVVEDDASSSASSFSNVEHENPDPDPVAALVIEESSSVKSKVNRLFGREKPVHHVLGGGKLEFESVVNVFEFDISRSGKRWR